MILKKMKPSFFAPFLFVLFFSPTKSFSSCNCSAEIAASTATITAFTLQQFSSLTATIQQISQEWREWWTQVVLDGKNESVFKQGADSVFKDPAGQGVFISNKLSVFKDPTGANRVQFIQETLEETALINSAGFATVSTTVMEAVKAQTQEDHNNVLKLLAGEAKQKLIMSRGRVSRSKCAEYEAVVTRTPGSAYDLEERMKAKMDLLKDENISNTERTKLMLTIPDEDLIAETFLSGRPLTAEEAEKLAVFFSVMTDSRPSISPKLDSDTSTSGLQYKALYKQKQSALSFSEKVFKDYAHRNAANIDATPFMEAIVDGTGIPKEELIVNNKTSVSAQIRALGHTYWANKNAQVELEGIGSELKMMERVVAAVGINNYIQAKQYELLEQILLSTGGMNVSKNVEDQFNFRINQLGQQIR